MNHNLHTQQVGNDLSVQWNVMQAGKCWRIVFNNRETQNPKSEQTDSMKDLTPRPSGMYPWEARTVQQKQVNQGDTPHYQNEGQNHMMV